MTLEQRLYDLLKGLVGDRCYPNVAKQTDPSPFIVLTNFANTPDTTICGSTEDAERLYQVDIYHQNNFDLIALRRSAFALLKAASWVDGIEGWSVDFEEATRLHRCLLTVRCIEREADI